ncbi:MAG: hypothetical protein CL845_09770 [Crocinitomicaceae bacterium]|nr:hypothetical protein [Crocinitomicaceae bacterium]
MELATQLNAILWFSMALPIAIWKVWIEKKDRSSVGLETETSKVMGRIASLYLRIAGIGWFCVLVLDAML